MNSPEHLPSETHKPITGYLWGALAVLTCPCHAVMLIFLLAGTAVGSWLVAVQAYLYLGFSLLFLFGLWLMVRRATGPCETGACRLPTDRVDPTQEKHTSV